MPISLSRNSARTPRPAGLRFTPTTTAKTIWRTYWCAIFSARSTKTLSACRGRTTPPAILFAQYDSNKHGDVSDYPIVATSYSPTEQWSSGAETHNAPVLNEMIPTQYIEMPVELAQEKGISNGDDVRVFNNRGSIVVKAMVTKRITPLTVNGETRYTVGLVHNWGWANKYTTGDIMNDLVPGVGDPTSFIPENKAFLVNIEKA